MFIQDILRTELIKIAQASEIKDHQEVKEFITSLETKGKYTEATEDEIEELDNLYDRFVA